MWIKRYSHDCVLWSFDQVTVVKRMGLEACIAQLTSLTVSLLYHHCLAALSKPRCQPIRGRLSQSEWTVDDHLVQDSYFTEEESKF
jgi:hypothetical protein